MVVDLAMKASWVLNEGRYVGQKGSSHSPGSTGQVAANSHVRLHPRQYLSPLAESSSQPLLDSRARVPCKYLSRPGGCQNSTCPFLHSIDGNKVEDNTVQDAKISENEARRLLFGLRCREC
jgi:hypothetical protein